MYDEAYTTELHIEYCTKQVNKKWSLSLKGITADDYFVNRMMWDYYNKILRYWSIMYGTHGC